MCGDVAFVADRIDLLAEVAALEVDVAVFERRHGFVPELADLRHRLDVVRAVVLGQVRGLPWMCETTCDVMH
jgi:hypothetical protein